MSGQIGSGPGLTRRGVLTCVGAVTAGAVLEGCAFLRGGASHPQYALAPSQQHGATLRLPVKQMTFPADGVVLVEPEGGYPKLLVRRVPDGTYEVVTANCTHLGCVVGWDPSGRRWSCPCHGSAFATDGKVLHGPANKPLGTPPSRLEGDELVIEMTPG